MNLGGVVPKVGVALVVRIVTGKQVGAGQVGFNLGRDRF